MSSGDQYSISIGGDAFGPVVAGSGNVVETHSEQAEQTGEDQTPRVSQRNTAKDHGTVFAVTHGDMHVYRRDESE